MNARVVVVMLAVCLLGATSAAQGEGEAGVTYREVIAEARRAAPDLRVARAREAVARSEIRVARAYPNPLLSFGTSTQTARLSVAASIPLLVFGQRGAAEDASRADLVTVQVETEQAWSEVRVQASRAFIALWLAEQLARERQDVAKIAADLERLVAGRVELGAAPELDLLRAKAERLRADADSEEARQNILAAGSELGRWIGHPGGSSLRTRGGLSVPGAAPPLRALLAKIGVNPAVRREQADARAAEARVKREKAQVRPLLLLDLGVETMDPTLPAPNYHTQLGVELPLFDQRGGPIERERASARAAHARGDLATAQLAAELSVAYRIFEAMSARSQALEQGVIPAADVAAKATQESYSLGRAPLLAVLDSFRASIDATVSLREAQAARANAWTDIERVAGAP